MGRGIATRLLTGGNSVVIMDRDNAEAKKLVEELGSGNTATHHTARHSGNELG